jgi:hypothetical protein
MIAVPVARWCAVLLLVVGIAGCRGGDDSAPKPAELRFANWPETLADFRFRWSAEPGIDLLTGPAVPLRAYLESHRVGDLTLDLGATYPGFQRAVPEGPPNSELFPNEPHQLRWIRPYTDPRLGFGPPGRFYGNEYFHVLDLTPIDGGYRAYVCDGLYKIFREGQRPGTFAPVFAPTAGTPDPDDKAVEVWRVEFTDHPNPPGPNSPPMVTAPQEGPNPAPLGDVFGPWRITGASPGGFWGPTDGSDPAAGLDPAWEQLMERCLGLLPHDAAQRHAFYASEPDTPPAVEPALPGWPGSAA